MTIAYNDDLLTEILIWLPEKSLIRFKLVCKRWFSLISSHYFSHRHILHHHHRHSRSKPEPSLLLRLSEASDYFYLQFSKDGGKLVPYHFSPTLIEPTILSFSNGLFLLQCRNVEKPLEECHIYNPITKQSRKILLNTNERYRCVMGLNLAFDPSKSPHYKIICVRAIKRRSSRALWCRERLCQIEVYESETGTWKICGEPFWAPTDVDFNHGIYWKNGIHWDGDFFDLQDNFVGKHPEIVVPGDTRTENYYGNYVESYGYLHYIAHFPEKKSGESEEDSMLVLHEPGKVMAYKFQEKSGKEIIDFREEAFYQERCHVRCYFFDISVLLLLINQLEPLTEQQLLAINNLQQSSQQAEDALSQGMEALQQSLAETVAGSLGP
ncbi:hypothetical protein DH2020_031078 [Rehmannia glutinosa]|uniref:F-box domain-containing protein n=1 Tax=Rehmannia glutinosa TaxID=99300 RepID=A0ABR0VIZ3_REHGL